MKNLFLKIAILGLSLPVLAIDTNPCENIKLNNVESMKSYCNGSIKIFEIDNVEPADAPVGIAIAIDRGEDLSTQESFCRYIPYLTKANIQSTKSSYNQKTGILNLKVPATEMDEEGKKIRFRLSLKVDKSATSENNLVTFDIEK
jgi:hypothetical protein